MGDLTLKCPLCCNRTFDSKTSLVEHLANILSNITCPICDNKWSSLAHLIEHLNLDGCQPKFHTIETIGGNNESSIDNSLSQTIDCDDEQISMKEEFEDHARSNSNQIVEEYTESALNNGKMYMGLLSDEKLKACLQSQELKLVSQDGEMEQFVIMSQGDGSELSIFSAVVSKQNDDGTISLTTVNSRDMKTESATELAPSETEVEDNREELYSCNTCGVSFSSVIDHIQSCHNDQEVVVEEPYDDDNGMGGPIHYNTVNNEVTTEKQEPPRRVITESGDIVEAGALIINITGTENEEVVVPSYLEDVPKVDKQTRLQGKRFVQIDEFCDSLVKNIKPADEKGGPYHKVVVKEVQALGGDKVKTYYCMSCNIYVSKLKDFKLHPCKILKYPCPHCPVAYENSKSLCAHMKVHKGRIVSGTLNTDSRGTYECEVCNTIFLTNKSLKLHKRMHDPVKTRPIEPPIENSDGTEGSTGMYRCPVCDKMMPTDYRTVHQNSHKSTELNCAVCNKKFHSSEYLEMHMSVHTIDKLPVNKTDKSLPYSCLYCNRRFARPHEKVKHERIHTGEKPHSCEICGKSFRVRYCLTLHLRTHTGVRPYTCQHCGKRFKAHSVYNHHLLTHSDLRAYKCPFCPKAFKTSVQLAGHKNSHTKPFSCQHCNRPFASLYAVRVHTETHLRHNNLKFSCTLCGASYARAFALKDHVKQLHDREMATDGAADTIKEKVEPDGEVLEESTHSSQ